MTPIYPPGHGPSDIIVPNGTDSGLRIPNPRTDVTGTDRGGTGQVTNQVVTVGNSDSQSFDFSAFTRPSGSDSAWVSGSASGSGGASGSGFSDSGAHSAFVDSFLHSFFQSGSDSQGGGASFSSGSSSSSYGDADSVASLMHAPTPGYWDSFWW